MKSDVIMYDKVYSILKNKIESGLLPAGTKLPSRARMCEEFHTSEKTVRRAVELLSRDGFIETVQRKRPTVVYSYGAGHKNVPRTLNKADAVQSNDILKTGILLCYPLNARGLMLCSGDEWKIPEAILDSMDPNKPNEFWRLSNRFWRFFVCRIGNDLILRMVDSLGFSEIDPLPGTYEIRKNYRRQLTEFVQTMKAGGDSNSAFFDDLTSLYEENGMPAYHVSYDSPFRIGTEGLEKKISGAQERYSGVYMDLLGLIAVGYYRKGERLPSHVKLREIYGVSIDTTIRAIQKLQQWGVVTAKRGNGIYVAMDLEDLKKIYLDRDLIACYVRRFLDSLELLSLTIESVAVHAAGEVKPDEALKLKEDLDRMWNEHFLYQLSPHALLHFIVDHIQYRALKCVYQIAQKNYRIGRSIPNLVNRVKNQANFEIHQQCMDAAAALEEGNASLFAERVAVVFQFIQSLVIEECKKLHYWDAAMQVYDGDALWR